MSNPLAFLRALLIYGTCVPLALYLGYMLASPLDLGTWVAVGLVLLALLLPLLLRWHHPLLLLCWNLNAVVFFLPGQPAAWLMMAGVSLAIALVQRALNRQMKFISVTSLTLPILFLLAVVLVTGWLTGGMGLRVANSGTYGGRRYIMMCGAIMGFFALCSRRIPPERANLYVGLFFLPGVVSLITSCFPLINSAFYFIYLVFPPDSYLVQAYASQGSGSFSDDVVRLGGLAIAGQALFCFLLAKHGIRSLLQTRNWWRLAILLVAMVASLFGGFRSAFISMALIFFLLFWFEGLARTRLLFGLLAAVILVSSLTVPFIRQMPLPVQRALSFLPLDVDPIAAANAQSSTEWRLRIWQIMWPEVPHYLILGKGFSINAQDLELAQTGVERGLVDTSEVSMLAGDYHSGPLSTIISLGIWGALGFVWLWAAGIRALWKNWKYGPPELKHINTFLLAFFVAKIIFFNFVYGSVYSDLAAFIGPLALAVSLNGGMWSPVVEPRRQMVLRESRLPQPARG